MDYSHLARSRITEAIALRRLGSATRTLSDCSISPTHVDRARPITGWGDVVSSLSALLGLHPREAEADTNLRTCGLCMCQGVGGAWESGERL